MAEAVTKQRIEELMLLIRDDGSAARVEKNIGGRRVRLSRLWWMSAADGPDDDQAGQRSAENHGTRQRSAYPGSTARLSPAGATRASSEVRVSSRARGHRTPKGRPQPASQKTGLTQNQVRRARRSGRAARPR